FADRARREGGEDYREFAALRSELRNDLRRLGKGLRRVLSRRSGRAEDPLSETAHPEGPPPSRAGGSE
ncbi:MAG: hypothetical protein ACE5HP_12875, partial [Gemmatimonadota bacterium]